MPTYTPQLAVSDLPPLWANTCGKRSMGGSKGVQGVRARVTGQPSPSLQHFQILVPFLQAGIVSRGGSHTMTRLDADQCLNLSLRSRSSLTAPAPPSPHLRRHFKQQPLLGIHHGRFRSAQPECRWVKSKALSNPGAKSGRGTVRKGVFCIPSAWAHGCMGV